MKLTLSDNPIVKSYTSKKTGKPYKKVFLKTKEYGGDLLSGFFRAEMQDWKAGMEVEVQSVGEGAVSQDGKSTFRDFTMPEKKRLDDVLPEILAALHSLQHIQTRQGLLLGEIAQAVVKKKEDYPDGDTRTAFDEPETEVEMQDDFENNI